VDFRQSLIILTSNVGGTLMTQMADAPEEVMDKAVLEELKTHFKPEFLNRLDDIIVFHRLDPRLIEQIVERQVDRLRRRLAEKNLNLELDASAVRALAQEGYDPVYGARPLKRAIQHLLADPLAKRLLSGEFLPGNTILVTAKENLLRFSIKK
jgi:ATP-dependent Clp protease ATP-binding subunit ClpB